MKYLCFLVALLIITPCFADVIVISDSKGNIYTISEKDDTVVPDGFSKSIISGKTINDLGLIHAPDMYSFSNGKIKLDNKKIADKVAKEEADAVKQAEKEAKKEVARLKLKDLGLEEEEINALLGIE